MNRGPRSLRARVSLAAAVGIAIATTIVGAGELVLVGDSLRQSVDDGLRARATELTALQATTPQLLDAPGALDSAVGGRALLVEVLDGQGRLLHRSLALGGRVLPADDLVTRANASGRPQLASRTAAGRHLRLYVAPLAPVAGADAGAVVVAADLSDVDENLGDVRRVTLIAALLGMLAGVVATWLLARRAMRPLTTLTAAADEIGRSAAGDERLPAPGTGDEVERLAETLNRMLASLEAAREREQRFVADAAHELRTPITALLGNAAFVARHGAEPDALADLEADATRLARTLDDLVALAREEGAGPPADRVRLDEVARRVAPDGVERDGPGAGRGAGRRRRARAGGAEPDRERAAARPARRPGDRARRAGAATARWCRCGTRGPGWWARRRSARSTGSGAAPRRPGGPDRGSASRSSAAPPSGTAAPPGSRPAG